jgi:GTP 3',8-cyclase
VLLDRWGRQLTYLRISVTDRCNLRCVYCMPSDGIVLRDQREILRFEEIALVTRIAVENGIRRVRLTGGEPLARLDLPVLVRMLADIPQLEEISLTTNGILLEKMAAELADAGLKRVNVSLDTLQPEKFQRITRGGVLESVWRGLAAAEKAGLAPIKLNVVVMRGVNDAELVNLARLTLDHPWHVRFIELMPVKNERPWEDGFPASTEAFLPNAVLKQQLAPLGLTPAAECSDDGPAQVFKLAGAIGQIGFISPLSDHFCQRCNRLRITADGCFRSCLLQDEEIAFLPALRAGEPILPLLHQAAATKPAGHTLAQSLPPSGRCMLQIGG